MGLFGKKINIPDWASYFTKKEYSAFIDALDHYIKTTLKLSYHIDDGILYLEDSCFSDSQYGLYNLAQTCRQYETDDYLELICSHFNCMIESAKFQEEFDKIKDDFEKVKEFIAVRLYDKEYMSSVGKEYFVGKSFAGELFAAIVFDFPHNVASITPDQAKPWGKTSEELIELGLANGSRNYDINAQALELGPNKDIIYYCETEHFFAANILFELETRTGLVGKGGSLVAVPNRNTAIIYPVQDLKVMDIISRLCMMVPEMCNNSPGKLTDEIYWYKNGIFVPLPYEITKNKIQFASPVEFIEMLNGLEK